MKQINAISLLALMTVAPGQVYAQTTETVFESIVFAMGEVENATKTERTGVISFCSEATLNANESQFWNNLALDCTQFIALSLNESFGRSISSSCLGNLTMSEVFEASADLNADGLTLPEVNDKLREVVAVISDQPNANFGTTCREAIRKVYITTPRF